MVFASICEHATTVFIFASTSCCQIFLASSEHFRKYRWRAAPEHFRKIEIASSEHFEYFVNFPRAGISLLLIGLTKSRAIEYMLTRVQVCEQLQKFCEHEQASTRLIFASNSSKGQFLRALLN